MTFATRYKPNEVKPFNYERDWKGQAYDYEYESNTEQTGYRDTKDVVETFINAGKRLSIERHILYNQGDDDDVDEIAELYCDAFDIDDIASAKERILTVLEMKGLTDSKMAENIREQTGKEVPEPEDKTKAKTETAK